MESYIVARVKLEPESSSIHESSSSQLKFFHFLFLFFLSFGFNCCVKMMTRRDFQRREHTLASSWSFPHISTFVNCTQLRQRFHFNDTLSTRSITINAQYRPLDRHLVASQGPIQEFNSANPFSTRPNW